MKKNGLMMVSLTALLFMSSCSSDGIPETNGQEPNNGQHQTEQIDTTGLIPIAFGTTNSYNKGTRAADATLTNEDEIPVGQIGVFGVARDITDMNPSPLPIKWFDTDTYKGQEKCACLYNVEAGKIRRDDGSGAYALQFSEPKYYPITNFYRYEFFAYYPRTADANLDITQKNSGLISTWLIADGYTDILWGHLYDDNTPYAYSGKWVRDRRKAGEVDIPTLKLYHQLLRLEFIVTPGEEDEIPELADLAVKEITVLDVPTQMKIEILQPNLNERECAKIVGRRAVNDVTVFEDGREKTPLQPVDIPNIPGGTRRVGSDIMLVPETTYTIKIVLVRKSDGKTFNSEYPLQIGVREELKGGYTYKVTMKVHTPKLIDINTTIEDWKVDEANNPTIYI